MKQLRWVLAAAAISVLAVPTLASAETTVIKKIYRGDGPRAEMRMHHDRGMHRGWNRGHRGVDKVVIIKKRHRGWH